MQTLMVFNTITQQFIFIVLLISGVNLVKIYSFPRSGIGSGTLQCVLQALRNDLGRELFSSTKWMKKLIQQVNINMNEVKKEKY